MAGKHGVQFETSKYVLIHFTRNHRRETNAAITVEGIRIDPAKEAKYLGVIFDQKLQFKKHLQYIIRKGTSAALALSDIAKNNWGAKYKYVRQLFKSVIAARTDYAAIIWHQPKDNDKIATESQVSKLSAIQRLAMKAITGCYKTTPTAAMEIEAGLQPTWPHLQTKVLQAVARMQTLSAKHPLQKWIKNAMRTRTSHCRHQYAPTMLMYSSYRNVDVHDGLVEDLGPRCDGFQDIQVLQHLCAKVRGHAGKIYFVDDQDVMEERLRKDLRSRKCRR